MDLIKRVVGFFKEVADSSIDIKQYRVGEEYLSNDSFQEYPVLFLYLPITYTYNENKSWYNVSVRLSVYHNISKDQWGNPTATTPYYLDDSVEQLNYASNILNDIIQSVEDSIYTRQWQLSVLSVGQVQTVTRVWNDDVSGVETTLQFRLPYACQHNPINFQKTID